MAEFQEYPKALYLHPADDSQEQKTKVVENVHEEELALAQGWKLKPHVPGAEVVSEPEPAVASEPPAQPEPTFVSPGDLPADEPTPQPAGEQ